MYFADISRLERKHNSTCGGFGGPRERLESIMGKEKMDLFSTQKIRSALVLDQKDGEELPHGKFSIDQYVVLYFMYFLVINKMIFNDGQFKFIT